MEAFDAFNQHVGFLDGTPVFHQLRAGTRTALSRQWLSDLTKSAASGRTPHSLRVGGATELYAAGVPVATIMAIGRWTSMAAMLYVLGTLEDTIEASTELGKGKVRITSDGLRRATRATMPRDHLPQVDAERWAAACEA